LYFYSVDGTDIEWFRESEKALTFTSKETAEREATTLNLGHHLITPSDGSGKLLFQNFRVEEMGQNSFIICFDAKPEVTL
jgi:hypothetical protein